MILLRGLTVVRDVSHGVAATRLFALLMTIEGVAPILAPALGGVIDSLYGWRAVMLVLAGMGVLVLGNSLLNLPETLPPARREALRLGDACHTYLSLLRDRSFLRPTLAVALFGLGIAESTLMSLVMSSQQKSLGSTAALLGAIQLSVSSCASPLAALALQHGPLAWGVLLSVCTLLVCLLSALSLRGQHAGFALAGH